MFKDSLVLFDVIIYDLGFFYYEIQKSYVL